MIRQSTYPGDRSDSHHSAHPHSNDGPSRRHSTMEQDWTPPKNSGSGADQMSESLDPPSKRRRVALACTV